MTPRAQVLYQVIGQVRSCFHQLRTLGDELHRDLGITASMRAVMESLAEDGEQTVPQIARVKGVSRQHIQVNVDELVVEALVVLRDNPMHRRSPFLALSRKGRTIFEKIRRKETKLLESIAQEHRLKTLRETVETLVSLKDHIVKIREQGGRHG